MLYCIFATLLNFEVVDPETLNHVPDFFGGGKALRKGDSWGPRGSAEVARRTSEKAHKADFQGQNRCMLHFSRAATEKLEQLAGNRPI